ncbi:hypothetical protein BMI86_20015 [Thioclava sp. DLFJ5-1]|nr:hypothetical protein BMI86_20015 [Thioclava sp. DLFJ5-1]
MQAASDAIARNIYENHIQNAQLPTLIQIGNTDAFEVVDVLNDAYPGYDINYDVWSGNILFVGLGEIKYFQDNLLNSGDTYSLLVALRSLVDAGLGNFVGAGAGSFQTLAYSFSAIDDALGDANEYFKQSYGFETLSADKWLRYISAVSASGNLFVGSELSDGEYERFGAFSTIAPSIIQAGAGDDEIDAGASESLVDGGRGSDIAFFTYGDDVALSMDLFLRADRGTVPYVGDVVSERNDRTRVYDVEEILLSSGQNRLVIQGDPSKHSQILKMVNAGDGVDIVDLSEFTGTAYGSSAYVDLGDETRDGSITFDTLSWQIAIRDFEQVLGSSGRETIQGGSGGNIIDGGGGDDVIYDGEGDDLLYGGEGEDFLADGRGSDVILGGAGNDVIRASIDYSGDDGGIVPEISFVEGPSEPVFQDVQFGHDIIDGGEGYDTVSVSSTVYIGSDGTLLLAKSGHVTDVLLNFEAVSGAKTVDFSASEAGVDYDGGGTLYMAGKSIEFPDLTEIIGSQRDDDLTAYEHIKSLFGGDGDDVLDAGGVDNVNLSGGRGDDVIHGLSGLINGGDGHDVLFATQGKVIGGTGNDILTVSGAGEMFGGAGADTLIGGLGSTASGDVLDTLNIDGIDVSGNGRLFGMDGFYRFGNARDNLLSSDWAIMVRPAFVQAHFDGTQASIVWEGRFIKNVSESILNESGFYNGYYDGRINFVMGDFGLQDVELEHDHGLDVYSITTADPITGNSVERSVMSLPVGDVIGSQFAPLFDSYENADLTPDGQAFDWGSVGFTGISPSEYVLIDELAHYDYPNYPDFLPPENPYAPAPPDEQEIIISKLLTDIVAGTTYFGFDPALGMALVYDGSALDPNSPVSDVTLLQDGADTVISKAGKEDIRLQGVSLLAWQDAVVNDFFGSAESEQIDGGSADSSFVPGAGNDTIIPGSGDDFIMYSGGDDLIEGYQVVNSGADTLYLGGYNLDEIQFSIKDSYDLVVNTPDGSISLEYQLRYETGDERGNIETLILADGSYDAEALKTLSVSTQSSDGDDEITGTQLADTIVGGLGDDTIAARNGDDLIVYSGGDDVVLGYQETNYGTDTLFIGEYTFNEVSFTVDDTFDTLITTPGGTIRLEYQLRHEPGDSRGNIETIVFADGGSLDAGQIKSVSVTGQQSAGDDEIIGTRLNDMIAGGLGNDTIAARFGDDVIFYEGGNDVILGYQERNSGTDTLVLSQYSSDQVSFSRSGNYDTLITTPDGTIRLEYQMRYEVGHERGNIEAIVFSDGVLDAQGIADRTNGLAPTTAMTPVTEANVPLTPPDPIVVEPDPVLASMLLASDPSGDSFNLAPSEEQQVAAATSSAQLSSQIDGDALDSSGGSFETADTGESGVLVDGAAIGDAFLSATQLASLDGDQASIY